MKKCPKIIYEFKEYPKRAYENLENPSFNKTEDKALILLNNALYKAIKNRKVMKFFSKITIVN